MGYILVINGKPQGPFSIEELKELKIKPADFVKTAAMEDYKEAQELPELRALFGFKKPPLLVQYYGSFDQRLLATAIDWFIVAGAFILLALIATIFAPGKEAKLMVAGGCAALIPLARLVYNIVMESSIKQATYGKQLLNIKVMDLNGDRLSTAHAAGRNLAKIISTALLFSGYLVSFLNKQHQCLHDNIAGTMVVRDRLL